jgi:hypothetical protein
MPLPLKQGASVSLPYLPTPQNTTGIPAVDITSPGALSNFWHSPTESWTDRYLPDPIGNKNPLIPVDKPLQLNPLQTLALNTKTVFVTTPKTIVKGLRGDRDFTFADFMLLSKVPYYLGGVFFVLAHIAPKNSREALRTGVGVGLYYLANQLTNAGINGLYWARYGIPLGLQYKSTTGRIEPALNTADFPRTDILTDAQYDRMAKKMGVPDTVADPKVACNQQIRQAIVSSRAMKLIVGNILAAVGAGYIAKHSGWDQWFGKHGAGSFITEAGEILADPKLGSPLNRLNVLRRSVGALMAPMIDAKFTSGPPLTKCARPIALGLAAGSIVLAIVQSLVVLKRNHYETSEAETYSRLQTPTLASSSGAFKAFTTPNTLPKVGGVAHANLG